MSKGSSPLQRPEQPPAPQALMAEDTYYLLSLKEAQAYFDMSWLANSATLAVSTAVDSSFYPNHPAAQSLLQTDIIEKGTTCKLPISTNLTGWLPARATDRLGIKLQYIVVRDTPFQKLVAQMQKIKLAAVVSKVSLEWGIAAKVSEITGQVLSYLLKEGNAEVVFEMHTDFNLAELQTGYYAQFGSNEDRLWPRKVFIDGHRGFYDENLYLPNLCYALFYLRAIPRRGQEVARSEAWWELLQAGKDQALSAAPSNKQERQKVMADWRAILVQARKLSRQQNACLLKEIDEMIREAHGEVESAILPTSKGEAFGDDELPEEWQELLSVETRTDLYSSVANYRSLKKISKDLLDKPN